eukprot:2145898-Amphidinium_carterae.1
MSTITNTYHGSKKTCPRLSRSSASCYQQPTALSDCSVEPLDNYYWMHQWQHTELKDVINRASAKRYLQSIALSDCSAEPLDKALAASLAAPL